MGSATVSAMPGDPPPLVLDAGPTSAVFDLARGARLVSLRFGDHELLVGPETDPMRSGSYPMVPYAGRVRHGRFDFGGREYRLPITLGPHAIHGTAYRSVWSLDRSADPGGADAVMVVDLGGDWPFPCRLEQRATLAVDRLTVELRLVPTAGPMPAMLGWHPWFRRHLVAPSGADPAAGASGAELIVDAAGMVELDDELIPTGRVVDVPPGPWDNPFTGLARPPVIRWPGIGVAEITSSCAYWVIYTEPEHAICVEPQTAVPDVFNRPPGHPLDAEAPATTVEPGQEMTATMTIAWTPEGSEPTATERGTVRESSERG